MLKKTGLIWVLLGCVLIAAGITQCGGGTTTTNGPINSTTGDGGPSGTGGSGNVPPPSGW